MMIFYSPGVFGSVPSWSYEMASLWGLLSIKGNFRSSKVVNPMKEEKFRVDNGAGWTMDVRRYVDPVRFEPDRRPVVLVPGYCMNSFILNFHPRGESLIEYLAREGFEVWATNMRGQGESTCFRRRKNYGFADLALVDLPAALGFVRSKTETGAGEVDLVGCSLGAPVSYIYLAHNPDDHGVGALVNLGGPLRWNRVHPLVRRVMSWPRLAGAVPIRGTRRLARLAIPVAQRAPWLLSFYLNPDIIDMSSADELVKTIDDPDRRLTREIAEWVGRRDLIVGGLNISHSLYAVDVPLLCIIAGQDGVVTPESALSVLDHIGSYDTEVIEVGSDDVPHAHADLFISDGAQEKVFAPLARWLRQQNGEGALR